MSVVQGKEASAASKTNAAGSAEEKSKPVFSVPGFGASSAEQATSEKEKEGKEDILSPTEQ